MAEWLRLTDDEVLALARVLASIPTDSIGYSLSGDAQYRHYLEARRTIDRAAEDVIHESRAARR